MFLDTEGNRVELDSQKACPLPENQRHVNLGFRPVALLSDPQKVLLGNGVKMQHVKTMSVADAKPAQFAKGYCKPLG